MNPLAWWLIWLLLKGQGANYGQGGVKQRLRLPGYDKTTMYDLVFYGDGTRFVSTPRARFWVKDPELSKPIKIDYGSAADVADAIKNYPE